MLRATRRMRWWRAPRAAVDRWRAPAGSGRPAPAGSWFRLALVQLRIRLAAARDLAPRAPPARAFGQWRCSRRRPHPAAVRLLARAALTCRSIGRARVRRCAHDSARPDRRCSHSDPRDRRPAAGQVHRRDQLEARRKLSLPCRARYRDVAGFERFAQHFRARAGPTPAVRPGQHAAVRQRNFAGRGCDPPPTRAMPLAVWMRDRKRGWRQRPRSRPRPEIDATAAHSSASASVSGGRIDGRREASIVLPLPGGPHINR